ncbi:MAG: FeoB-associated Cys-rich membrane protein [Clostridia bacterium]|nr:FeoB-associated Cys-rich membrane protein [Clostridia bacterium]
MGLPDIIAIVVIALIIGGAVAYIIKAKKSGKKCIGCPDSGSCAKGGTSCNGCSCCSACHTSEEEKE